MWGFSGELRVGNYSNHVLHKVWYVAVAENNYTNTTTAL